MARATSSDRIAACVGSGIAIALLALFGMLVDGPTHAHAWIAAPVAASAVLLFLVPASPLTQPWPVIGGTCISAAVGLAVGATFGHHALAAGLAVGLAIGAMSVTRSLHPPGGALAMVAVLGVPLGHSPGLTFLVLPVGVDVVLIVAFAWAFHRYVTGHSYPHVTPDMGADTAGRSPAWQVKVGSDDIDSVLARLGDSFDITREDLGAILGAVEAEAVVREYGKLTCQEIMSTDVNPVAIDADVGDAVRLLVDSGARMLPVLEESGSVAGAVGLRNLSIADTTVEDAMVQVPTVPPDRLAIELSEPFAERDLLAVIVVDDEHRPLGMISPGALLAAIAR